MVPRQSRALSTPGTSWRRAARAVSLLRVLSLPLGCGFVAAATQTVHAEEKKTVVVLEIQGGTKALQQALTNALRDKYIILQTPKWNSAAKKLNVSGQAPEDYAMVAAEVKADVVITGKIKKDKDSGQWKANIAARDGKTGKPIGKMSYDLKSEKVDAETVAQVEKDVGPAVEKAIKGEGSEPAVAVVDKPTEPETPPGPLGKEEDPIAKMKKLEEEQRRARDDSPRPVWYPYIDASAGLLVNGRSFSFTEEGAPSPQGCYDFVNKRPDPNDPSPTPASVFTYGSKLSKCPSYAPSVGAGVRVDITGYPLAFMRANPIRGLGIGLMFDYVGWAPSTTGGANSVDLATTELRFEAGLRYHYNILNKRSRPSILANVQYGFHTFAIAKQAKSYTYMDENFMNRTVMGLDDHGLPDIFYQYVNVGLGGRVPYFANDKLYFGLILNVDFHILLSVGELGNSLDKSAASDTLYSASGYGPTQGGFGVRASLTLIEAMIWRGLTVRVQGFYELFKYGFEYGSDANPNTSLPPADRKTDFGARHIAPGATDNYFGGVVAIGYQY